MFAEITPTNLRQRKDVGGRDTLPPTSRLRTAYTDAHAAAYAETHKRAVSVFFLPVRAADRFRENGPKAPGKEFSHARAVSG